MSLALLLLPVLAVAISSSTSTELLNETRIALNDLARKQGVAPSTCWRWALRGCKGHVLGTFNVGQRRYTTLEEFARWICKINGESPTPAATPRQREAAQTRAERELAEMGI